MAKTSYVGSGPYCYSNSFSMMFGESSPPARIIEFATSSAFGMHLLRGSLPFFDPFCWTPEASFAEALGAMGWVSELVRGEDPRSAIHHLKRALSGGPVWVGPIEMGYLHHQPGRAGPVGADHYVVVLEMDHESVLMHDPEGFPYARLPLELFLQSWRTATLDYGTSFTMRHGFRQISMRSNADIICASLPSARRWLSCQGTMDIPSGTIGNGEAAHALADMIKTGITDDLRNHLIHFAVRVGARRAADAAKCLAQIAEIRAATVVDRQARLIGALQYPLVTREDDKAVAYLRSLAPTYDELLDALPN
ncbi:hypothetical protein GR138_25660 [Shinella kummerowiae]|jgi:hypothetical protein|uniref:RADC family protein n=1 Tax=Shinella kummerowiae TaxID=417745 RepID=A0A6N8SLD3_9HYPH|nr:hypothetical protein [Shinella kummerowiae]MXN48598.1 hypothetical protein [Shinella kummerowiae]